MNLTTARGWVQQFARNAGSTDSYPLDSIDRAIQTSCDHFIHRTRCTRTKTGLNLTGGSNILPAFPTRFRPEYLLRARILTSPSLALVDYDTLLDSRNAQDTSGPPQAIAFDTFSSGEVWPKPDQAYTVNFLWYEPLVTWVPGPGADGNLILNLPDEFLTQILPYGPTAILQHTEPQHKYASESWKKFLEFEQLMVGRGHLGSKVIIRQKADL